MYLRFLVTVFMLSAAPLAAQAREIEVAAGVAAPRGALRELRESGPFVRAAIVKVDAGHAWRLRLDGQAGVFRRKPSSSLSASRNDLRMVSAMVDLMVGLPNPNVSPYVFAGAGLQLFNTSGASGGTSSVAGFRRGLGMRLRIKRVRIVLETASTYAFTDRGTTGDVWLVNYRPVSLGVSF